MARQVSEMEIKLIDNASKALKNTVKQFDKLSKSLKASTRAAAKNTKQLSIQEAAQRKLNAAIRAEKIDKHIHMLEKSAVAQGKLSRAISKTGRASERAARAAERAAQKQKAAQFSGLTDAIKKQAFARHLDRN